jgi:hypothetical protein
VIVRPLVVLLRQLLEHLHVILPNTILQHLKHLVPVTSLFHLVASLNYLYGLVAHSLAQKLYQPLLVAFSKELALEEQVRQPLVVPVAFESLHAGLQLKGFSNVLNYFRVVGEIKLKVLGQQFQKLAADLVVVPGLGQHCDHEVPYMQG